MAKFHRAKLLVFVFSDYNVEDNSNNLQSPDFEDSVFRMYGYMVYWSIGPLVHWLIGPSAQWPIVPVLHWFIGPLVQWSIGPSVH